VAENIRRALIEDLTSELGGEDVAIFIPLIEGAVARMETEGLDTSEGYERARQAFLELAGRVRSAAANRGARSVEPADVQAGLRGFCPRWPIC
jgi:hypothetical protein